MAGIIVRGLHKYFRAGTNQVQAVRSVDLEVGAGEIVALLGPSGCGKTTTLRCVAGLERPDAGEIYLGDRLVFSHAKRVHVPTEQRGLGMVFQSYALWPHLSVFANVAYPLEPMHLSKAELRDRVAQALTLVQCSHLSQRFPGQLSGGQQQRVSLARAIVANPPVMLFDEPLSNLDAKLREQMRFEIVAIQRQIGFSAIYVTHDQLEAMTVANRIVVMHSGSILQIGNAVEIYDHPVDHTVASFVGALNRIPAKVAAHGQHGLEVDCPFGIVQVCSDHASLDIGSTVDLCVRPELVVLRDADGGENTWPVRIEQVAFLGAYTAYVVALGDLQLHVYDNQRRGLTVGQHAHLHLPPERCFVFQSSLGGSPAFQHGDLP